VVNTLKGIRLIVKGAEAIVSREVVSLQSDGFVLEVSPSAGSAITRYAYEDGGSPLDLLRPASPRDLESATPTGMACFPLVPFSNRVREGRFTFRDRDVQLSPNFPPEPHAIHGHGWQTAWTVEEQSGSGLTTAFAHEADEWPFPYRAEQRYSLSAEALEVTIALTNTGDEPMPAGLGLHPYFVRTPESRLTTGVEKVWLSDVNAMPSELVTVPDEWDLNGMNPNDAALDNNFTGWSGTALIEWPDRGARLTLTGDDMFRFLVVYTPPGEDFFCVEPVSNSIAAFNLAAEGRTDVGMAVVQPGERLSGAIVFAPELNL
jgi:aldose 1-epimerase